MVMKNESATYLSPMNNDDIVRCHLAITQHSVPLIMDAASRYIYSNKAYIRGVFSLRALLSLLRDKANNIYTDSSTINVRHRVLHALYDGDKLYNISGGGNFS